MSRREQIKGIVSSRIGLLQCGSPWASAEMARLRRCAGKRLEESPDAWESLFSGVPEEISPSKGVLVPTTAENAIFIALTLYAVHQQGVSASMNQYGRSFSTAVSMLGDGGSDNIRNRFNTALTSQDVVELSNHLRSLVKMLRSNDVPIGFDYADLAADIYDYQYEDSKFRVQMRWAKDYYRSNNLDVEAKKGEKE